MTYQNRTNSFRAGLIAGAALLAMSSGGAAAGEGTNSLRIVFASDGKISAFEAKRLAEIHLNRLGYSRIGGSLMSAGIRSIRLDGSVWKVGIAYGGTLGQNRTILLLDASTGRLLKSDLVEYATGIEFRPDVRDTELAESQAENN